MQWRPGFTPYHFSPKNGKGFTLMEILLLVAAIAVIAGASIFALNPARQMAEARNHQRRVDVATIWNALQQYALNNHGEVPGAVPSGSLDDCLDDPLNQEFTICESEACEVVLTELLEDGAYLYEIPDDPSIDDDDYSGYNVVRDEDRNNRVTVCAPAAEQEASIYLPG